MLNVVWLGLIAVAVVVGAATGRLDAVTKAAFDSARTAVELALGLVGVMALWLGVMRVAEEGGLVRALARALRPLARRVFPDVPPDHPALAAILLNVSASWLGLGNAAKMKLTRLLAERLRGDGIHVGEVMITGLVKGTAWDDGSATIEPDAVAAAFWDLYAKRASTSITVR